MFIQKLPNTAAAMIAVTSTSTLLLDLITTAAAEANNLTGRENAIDITPEDGDIRVMFDSNDPTATEGILIPSGTTRGFRGIPLAQMKLIRTGATNVSCSVIPGFSDKEESDMALTLASAADAATATNQTSLIAAVSGAAVPSVDTAVTSVSVNVAAGVTTEIIAAPAAGKQIKIYGGLLMADTAGTIALTAGGTELNGVPSVSTAGGYTIPASSNLAIPMIVVPEAEGLDVTTVTCTADGFIAYAIVNV